MAGFSASSAFARIGANAAERSLSSAIEGTLVFMRVSASNVYCQNLLGMVFCSLEALRVKLVRNKPLNAPVSSPEMSLRVADFYFAVKSGVGLAPIRNTDSKKSYLHLSQTVLS